MLNQPQNKASTWFAIRNAEQGKPAEVEIMDEIGAWGISAKAFRAEFRRIPSDSPVNLHICSPGGDITAGNEVANTIRAHKGEVNVTLGSLCASIATVVAMAGNKVTMAANGFFMVHEPWVMALGDSEELRKMAGIMDKMKAGIVAAYAQKTGMGDDELSALMAAETWMTADEAKAHGFIDAIDGEADAPENNFDLSRFKNSANFLSKLQSQNAPDRAASAGNGAGVVTLQDLEDAVKTQIKNQLSNPKGTKTMNPEEIAAQKAAQEKAIKDGIKAALDARSARDKEIKAAVALIAKRDKRDVSDIAETIFSDGEKTIADFHAAVNAAEKFTPVKGAIIGAGAENSQSGIEVIEPLDALRGTLGYSFVNSEQARDVFERVRKQGTHIGNVNAQIQLPHFMNVQTSTATSGSGLTSIEKLPGVVELGVRPLTIEDLIAPGQTANTTVRDIQEVTYTQAAAAVTETGTLAEITTTYTEVDFPVKDIGGYLVTSENLLADYLAIASLINTRIPYQVDRAVEDQLINGSGSGANITGILQTSGIQTLALGANTRGDLPLKLQTLVRWQAMTAGQAQGGFEPDGYAIHPTDWETLQLLKDSSGQYLCRGPFIGSYGQGAPAEFYTLWGKKVCVTPAVTQGTLVCGAWKMGAQKFDRQGMMIEMTNSNGTDFINRKITIRGTRRLALAVYRPASFVTGTGF